ncbi:hypothetical protein C464_06225 [Halorubrum coriense DSM 10284]|uniref:Uncharacterized protein n=1 Tax=Halorubrum coriense DSM 10284 TaxID=1227466 RepID=M0EMN2_9EURY|nr:hypothetical protein [Halorubrum coriense]ELZ48985.1 hypothetical protein C464_06225 [Halorubrum coriense DSM 10284]QRG24120.1 hypothetical protein HrrHm1_045 [Halorubrum virus Humcor1]
MPDYRSSVGDVRAELERTDFPTAQLANSQIETVGLDPAHLVVTEDLADTGQSEDRLGLIERYLAGHNILSSGIDDLRQTTRESTDREAKTYAGDFGEALRSTTLGQKAISMDKSGTLANAAKPTASIHVPDTSGGH